MRTGLLHHPIALPALLLGVGLGGFIDGIVFHQILQWHHMVSGTRRWPMTTLDGLKANTLADGLFHTGTFLVTSLGIWLLWRARRDNRGPWSDRLFVGGLVAGFGLFNVVEGLVDHVILGVHHVRQLSGHQTAWDIAFLVWGAVMLLGGLALMRNAAADVR